MIAYIPWLLLYLCMGIALAIFMVRLAGGPPDEQPQFVLAAIALVWPIALTAIIAYLMGAIIAYLMGAIVMRFAGVSNRD